MFTINNHSFTAEHVRAYSASLYGYLTIETKHSDYLIDELHNMIYGTEVKDSFKFPINVVRMYVFACRFDLNTDRWAAEILSGRLIDQYLDLAWAFKLPLLSKLCMIKLAALQQEAQKDSSSQERRCKQFAQLLTRCPEIVGQIFGI